MSQTWFKLGHQNQENPIILLYFYHFVTFSINKLGLNLQIQFQSQHQRLLQTGYRFNFYKYLFCPAKEFHFIKLCNFFHLHRLWNFNPESRMSDKRYSSEGISNFYLCEYFIGHVWNFKLILCLYNACWSLFLWLLLSYNRTIGTTIWCPDGVKGITYF